MSETWGLPSVRETGENEYVGKVAVVLVVGDGGARRQQYCTTYCRYTMDWLGGAVAERSTGMQELAGLSFLRHSASRQPPKNRF
jgi:hypothetical protein